MTDSSSPKQLLLAMAQQRYLNKSILRKMCDSKVMVCWQYDTSNPALIMNRRKLDWSWSPWIKYRGLPFLTIKKETVKTYNQPWTIMKEKHLYLSFDQNKDTIICEWEIDFLSFHDDVFGKYNVVAYPGVWFIKDLMMELIQTSRKDIIFLWDNDTPSKSAFYKAIIEVEALWKWNLKRIKYACGVLWNFKDINELVCSQCMTLWVDHIEKYIEWLWDTEVNKDIISKIFPHLSHYFKHLKKIDIPSLLELSTMDCEIWDRVVVITSINIWYSETNITHREWSGYVIYKYDGSTEPISFTNLEVTDVNHFKKKISTIKFIDLASMQKADMIYIMNNLKRLIDYLEKNQLVEIVKEYQSLGRISNDQFLFSNGILNTTTQNFSGWKNISQRHKALIINYPYPLEECPIIYLQSKLLQYINSDYFLFVVCGYLFATIYLQEIRWYSNFFPLLNLIGVKWVGKSYFIDLISEIVGLSSNSEVNLITTTEAWYKNILSSTKHILFLDEYGTKKLQYWEGNYIDEKLMSNYDGNNIIQGNISLGWSTTTTLPNQSSIIYSGMKSTNSEALLSRSIILNFEVNSTRKLTQQGRDEIVLHSSYAYFTQMLRKQKVNIINLYKNTEEFIRINKIDFWNNHRLKANYIIISMYWYETNQTDKILNSAEYFMQSSSANSEMSSVAASVINHIACNIEEYCSIWKCFDENKIPSIFLRHQWDGISINIKSIISTYKRLNVKDTSEIFDIELFCYMWWWWNIKQSYKEVIFPNGIRRQVWFVPLWSIQNQDVKELINGMRLHILNSFCKLKDKSQEQEEYMKKRIQGNKVLLSP